MILYFADRNLSVKATASTDLPNGLHILSDKKTDSIETGAKTFECSIAVEGDSVSMLDYCQVGNFLLRSADDGNEFYTIIESEFNAIEQTITLYCEDAGLDLLNTIVPEYTATAAHNMTWYVNYFISTYAPGWTIGIDESTSATRTLTWDGESTLTERLLSIATNFDKEIAFSYEINGLSVQTRRIDIYEKRGNKHAEKAFYIDREISSISRKESVAELATALSVTGGESSGKAVTFSGCNYSSDGTTTHEPKVSSDPYQIVGKQVRCIPAMEKWSSKLDSDGLLVRNWSYDTTNKKTLFGQAVAQLRKQIDAEVTYDIQFNSLPDVRAGDYINIVDDKDEIYVESRVLSLEISVISGEISATLGDFVSKSSGISERLSQLAEQIRKTAVGNTKIGITSTGGTTFHNTAIYTTLTATVYYGQTAISSQEDLEDVFGSDVQLNWYNNGTKIGDGFSTTVSSSSDSVIITAKVEV